MEKDTIFISHETPSDNEFAIWLTSRLQLMGYIVWIDKDALLGGEKFWERLIQQFVAIHSSLFWVSQGIFFKEMIQTN